MTVWYSRGQGPAKFANPHSANPHSVAVSSSNRIFVAEFVDACDLAVDSKGMVYVLTIKHGSYRGHFRPLALSSLQTARQVS